MPNPGSICETEFIAIGKNYLTQKHACKRGAGGGVRTWIVPGLLLSDHFLVCGPHHR